MTTPIQPTPAPGELPDAQPVQRKKPSGDFAELLARKLEGGVRFSGHAIERLEQRNISLSEGDLASLAEATDRAAAKGSKDSLVLLRDLALIVNIKNRTVLTALARNDMQDKVVTNIDSTVIAQSVTEDGKGRTQSEESETGGPPVVDRQKRLDP